MMGTMNLIEWRKREQKEEVNSSSRLSGSHIIKSQLQFWLFVINLTKKVIVFVLFLFGHSFLDYDDEAFMIFVSIYKMRLKEWECIRQL